ncbi:ATP-binding protein [Kitasatospora sp. NPDC047058]|uniref:ATP-binding protein n=1 Tax=Kitasatospora sp. NPDC047058 TaxID=3155620 RepID=UPI003403217B
MLTQQVDVEWMFPSHPRSAGRARVRLLRQAFSWRIPGETTEIAMLLLGELVTNACRHARAPRDRLIGVRLVLDPGELFRVEVSDANPDLPEPRQAGPEDETGRGLELVTALSAAWGAHARGAGRIGKTVWFELKPGTGPGI